MLNLMYNEVRLYIFFIILLGIPANIRAVFPPNSSKYTFEQMIIIEELWEDVSFFSLLSSNQSLLTFALKKNDLSLFTLLLNIGFDPNQGNNGLRPLEQILQTRNDQALAALLNHSQYRIALDTSMIKLAIKHQVAYMLHYIMHNNQALFPNTIPTIFVQKQ